MSISQMYPNFNGQSQQMFNQPMQQGMTSMFNPNMRPSGLCGRVVNPNEPIRPNEIPMDGSFGYFVSQDMKSIVAKGWNEQGTITTLNYVLEQEPQNGPTFEQMVMSRFDELSKELKKMKQNNRPYRQKKEGTTNE